MKKIDLSIKKISNERLSDFFKENPTIGELGRRGQFVELISDASELHYYSLNSIKETYHNRIHQNFLINLVSAIEIHLRELIKINSSNWNKELYSELLSDKISLENAFKIFKEVNVSRESIISKNSSFNSFESIVKTFCKLTKTSFVEDISSIFFMQNEDGGDVSLEKLYPKWQTTIHRLLEERNKIVHEGISHNKLDRAIMHEFHYTTIMFLYSLNFYCYNNDFNIK